MLKPRDQIELIIDRLSSGGRGVGRHEGVVVFVPDTAPEERVLVEITAAKKNFAEARLLRVLTPSPYRIQPPCPVAGECGGCSWQHVTYSEQLRQKRQIVADALRKFSGRPQHLLSGLVSETVASPAEFHYRNRIQVHFSRGKLGFFKRGTREIADIRTCHIADPRLNAELAPLRERLAEATTTQSVRKEMYLTESGHVAYSDEPRHQDELGFAQVNERQNRNLIDHVVTLAGSAGGLVLDLFSGAGNFSFPLAQSGPENRSVTAVELHPASVRLGRQKADALGLAGRVRFIEAKAEEFLVALTAGRIPDLDALSANRGVVVLDPPRAGCDPRVMEALRRLQPKRIIYISCDPVTMARDLSRLPDAEYALGEVRPFDMFPQTDHVEAVAVLDRRTESP